MVPMGGTGNPTRSCGGDLVSAIAKFICRRGKTYLQQKAMSPPGFDEKVSKFHVLSESGVRIKFELEFNILHISRRRCQWIPIGTQYQ